MWEGELRELHQRVTARLNAATPTYCYSCCFLSLKTQHPYPEFRLRAAESVGKTSVSDGKDEQAGLCSGCHHASTEDSP